MSINHLFFFCNSLALSFVSFFWCIAVLLICSSLGSWFIRKDWCWEGLGAGGEGDDRGWDGWMASLTRWTRVWMNSGSWWWTGRPGVRQFMRLQRVGHDWATELNWVYKEQWPFVICMANILSSLSFSFDTKIKNFLVLSFCLVYAAWRAFFICRLYRHYLWFRFHSSSCPLAPALSFVLMCAYIENPTRWCYNFLP